MIGGSVRLSNILCFTHFNNYLCRPGLVRHYGTQHADYQDCLSAKQQLGTIMQSVPDLLKSSVRIVQLVLCSSGFFISNELCLTHFKFFLSPGEFGSIVWASKRNSRFWLISAAESWILTARLLTETFKKRLSAKNVFSGKSNIIFQKEFLDLKVVLSLSLISCWLIGFSLFSFLIFSFTQIVFSIRAFILKFMDLCPFGGLWLKKQSTKWGQITVSLFMEATGIFFCSFISYVMQ